MENVLERERALAGNPQTFQTRIEMANSLYDGTYKTDQIHFDTLNTVNQFKENILPNSQYAAKLKQSCNSYFGDDVEAACQKLTDATQAYNAKVFSVGNALSHLEKSYSTEMTQQKAIIHEANSLNHN